MIISDLNHLDNAAEQPKVLGASGFGGGFNFGGFVIQGSVQAGANIFGNIARVSGDAKAFGPNTFTNVQGGTLTTPNSSHSSLQATSATSGGFHW